MDQNKKGVLLLNLGSPDNTEVSSVRKYLREFLMDKRVLDTPWLLRKLILELFILPSRPKKSAEAYRSIWWKEGSPLIVISRMVEAALKKRSNIPFELGMRYGSPSTEFAAEQLMRQYPNLEEVLVIPLYPHYAMSSFETAVVKAEAVFQQKFPQVKLTVQPPFYQENNYIDALAQSMRPYLESSYDHVLFSYHGIPERHVKKSDPTGSHCLCSVDCCTKDSPAHATCYKHQVTKTTALVAAKLGIDESKFSISFQSRLGRDPWLQPFTDFEIERLPKSGIDHLVVVCPSFVSDCLETLEEIGMEAKESFLAAGGKQFTLIPCLNDQPAWIDTLDKWAHDFVGEIPSGEEVAI